MSVYFYKARDKDGKSYSGTVEAGSENAAAAVVAGRGWVPTSIVEKARIRDLSSLWSSFQEVPTSSRVIFTRQLATMVNAGLPLTQSLDILCKQETNVRMKEVVGHLFHDVESGSSLNQSLAKYPEVFGRVYINLVKAGEASGALDKILIRLADNEEKMTEFTSRVKGAFVYPAIVVVVMLIVFIMMMILVVPRLTSIYKDLGVDLPLPTKILIFISDLFTQKFYLPLGAFIAAFLFWRSFTSTEYGIRKISQISMRLPVFGKLKKMSELTEFCRTLSLLVSAGVPILESLNIVSEAVNDPIYRASLVRASKEVERGVNLSVPLRADPNFPILLSQMVAVGEETGKLDEVLLKVSTFFERDTEAALKGLTVALEPIIMIVLGVVVGGLVISIILPIYKLTAQF